ncbi:MAG: hypothetical protein QW753_04715 [Thermofilum sp.]
MIARVGKISRLDYARVARIALKAEWGEVEVEIPERVLREAGLALSEGDSVNVEVAKEAGSLDEWDVVMGGEVYLKASNPFRVYASLGGLQLVLKSERDYERFQVGEKVYVKLRKTR